MSILKLLPMPPARIESGRILFDGRDVLRLSPQELHSIRGREIGVIFQDLKLLRRKPAKQASSSES